jgi:hypothetical protein
MYDYCSSDDLAPIAEDEGAAPLMPNVARWPRGFTVIDGKKHPCFVFQGQEYVLCRWTDAGYKPLDKLPPTPETGVKGEDVRLIALHGDIVSMQEFGEWFQELRKSHAK